ncbi:putative PB1 domain-containing protein [Tanacetum coccineum]
MLISKADDYVRVTELLVKLGELCGTPVALRCQLPTEDLDALISITCDEDLANLVEEYDATSTKIRAFLTLNKKPSPIPSTAEIRSPPRSNDNCVRKLVPEKRMLRCGKSGGNLLRYACENSSLVNIGSNYSL